jgi:ATP-dependent DNA helicase RecG
LVDGLVEKYNLTQNQSKILEHIIENNHISIAKLSEAISISTTAIDNNIVRLKALDVLRRVGPDKGGHWEIIEANKVE